MVTYPAILMSEFQNDLIRIYGDYCYYQCTNYIQYRCSLSSLVLIVEVPIYSTTL